MFSSSQKTANRVGTRGPINYDNDYHFDDNDKNDDLVAYNAFVRGAGVGGRGRRGGKGGRAGEKWVGGGIEPAHS